MLREHLPTEWVDLNLPLDLEARAFQPEIKPADPGEQTPDR